MIFKTILLDVDGTLLNFKATEHEALNKVFANHNYDLKAATRECYEKINQNLWRQYENGEIDRDTVLYTRFVKLFEELNINGDGVAFEDEYRILLGEGHHLIEGAIELVQYLHMKYDLYIVTNGTADTQRSRLKDSGLDIYMKDIFISGEIGYQKPMKEYFDYCFHRIPNIELNKTIIIGDSLSSDIKGGMNSGIAACWYNPDAMKSNLQDKITYEIRELKELYEIL